MANDLEAYNRILRNLYNAVFEREAKRSNRVFRQVFQIHTGGVLTMEKAGYITEVMRDFPYHFVQFDDSRVYNDDNVLSRQRHYDLARESDMWEYTGTTTAPLLNGSGLITGYGGDAGKITTASRGLQTTTNQSGTVRDFTLETVIEFSANPASGASWTLIDFGPTLVLNDARKLVLTNTTDTTRTATNALAPGRYHIAWVRNLGVGLSTLYVNGVAVDTWAVTNTSGTTIATRPKIMQIGATLWGGNCLQDAVAIYKHVLPTHRIEEHYRRYVDNDAAYPNSNHAIEVAPIAQYYTPVTVGGSESSSDDSSWGFSAGITASVSGNYGRTIGVIRLRPRWAFNSPPTNPTIFRARTDASNYLELFYNSSTNNWTLRRFAGGAGTDVTIAGNHATHKDITLAWYYDTSNIYLSLDGADWVSAANSNGNPAASVATEIGNGTNPSDSDVHWMLTFYGLTATAVQDLLQTFHAIGNFDPDFRDLPKINVAFLWWCRSAEHQANSQVGGSVHA